MVMRLRNRHELIARMEERDVSVRELARWAACHPSMIGHLRTGLLTSCTPKLAARIEKALGVEPGTLFEAPPKRSSSAPQRTEGRRWA
jgi:lambda repressor-like predicted transcriptional regulator